jgi:hypothetical protein
MADLWEMCLIIENDLIVANPGKLVKKINLTNICRQKILLNQSGLSITMMLIQLYSKTGGSLLQRITIIKSCFIGSFKADVCP